MTKVRSKACSRASSDQMESSDRIKMLDSKVLEQFCPPKWMDIALANLSFEAQQIKGRGRYISSRALAVFTHALSRHQRTAHRVIVLDHIFQIAGKLCRLGPAERSRLNRPVIQCPVRSHDGYSGFGKYIRLGVLERR